MEALDFASFFRKLDFAKEDAEEEQKRRMMEMMMLSRLQALNITSGLRADKDVPPDPDEENLKKEQRKARERRAHQQQIDIIEEWEAVLKSTQNYAAYFGFGELFGAEFEGPKQADVTKLTKKERLKRAMQSAEMFAFFEPTQEEEN